MRRLLPQMIPPLILGLAGFAVLVSLGLWQLQRLAWKQSVLAQIEAQIAATPLALPAHPRPPGKDRLKDPGDLFLPVVVQGYFTGDPIEVLVSTRDQGAGVRVISAFQTPQGRRVLVDRGFLPEALRHAPAPGDGGDLAEYISLTGNLNWPDEVDSYTPAPDAKTGLWFARDVAAMAAKLGTEPVLIVARSDTGTDTSGGTGAQIRPMPVDTSAIPNDHLGYAIQWFGLALVWAGMTAAYLWRITRPKHLVQNVPED